MSNNILPDFKDSVLMRGEQKCGYLVTLLKGKGAANVSRLKLTIDSSSSLEQVYR
jgi:hypothetical protein